VTRLRGTEAGTPPVSDATDLFRAHGVLIGRLPEDVPDPVDDDDQIWISAITTGPVGIPHAVMAEILGITIEDWLAPDEIPEHDDDDDTIDWEH